MIQTGGRPLYVSGPYPSNAHRVPGRKTAGRPGGCPACCHFALPDHSEKSTRSCRVHRHGGSDTERVKHDRTYFIRKAERIDTAKPQDVFDLTPIGYI